jgi:PAS domain S-box-containing protein
MQRDKPHFSLRWKILLIVSAAALVSALLISGVSYFTTRHVAFNRAIEKLAGETQLVSLKIKTSYAEMKSDALAIARAPSMADLVATIRNGGAHPENGTDLEHWRNRLNSLFASILNSRAHYTKIRYVELAENGREVVRVNRSDDGEIEPVSPERMQEIGAEPFFLESSGLNPGAVYISKVTYNREHGVTDPAYIPTVRIVVPVVDKSGKKAGIVVINVHYGRFLESALHDIKVANEVYVTDAYGDYIYRDASGKLRPLELAGAYRATPPAFIEDFVTGRLTEGVFDWGDRIGYCNRMTILDGAAQSTIGAFFLTPRARLFADANALISQNLLLSIAIIIIAALLAAWFAERVTSPMARMTAAIEAIGDDRESKVDLPVDASDEIGVMAKAFQDLIEKLNRSDEHSAFLSLQLDTFIMNSVDGVIIINEFGIIEEANPAALEIFGYERSELLGRNVSILMPAAVGARHDAYLDIYRQTGRQTFIGIVRDEEGRRRDGTVIPIALSISEMQLNGRRVFGGIIRDMSAMHEAQRRIKEYTDELERSNQELDQFAYVASHDLKAPLRVIDNASRWLEEDLATKLTDEDRENMVLLRSRVRRMEKLLDDLLAYSRLGKSGESGYREVVQVSEIVDDIVALLSPPPSIELKVAPQFADISACRMPLQLVFYNLINNAIKHHDRDSGTIGLEVDIHADHYSFTVRDDGPGIPAEYRETIFEMFHTLKPRDQVEGSGMGLALVKKAVENLGGQVWVHCGAERGAAFHFTWPRYESDSIATGKAA